MQTRELALGKADAKSRTVPLTLSTETPVQRDGYLEVLDHSGPRSVDLSRAPLPLIESHDTRKLPIGVVNDLRVEGRKLRGVAVFGNSARAQEVFKDVQDGILRSVSIGYEYVGTPVSEGDGDTLRFKFKPVEVSAVAVPADDAAGFYRSYKVDNATGHQDDNQSTQTRSQRRRARVNGDEIRALEEIERQRCTEIRAMCRAHNLTELSEELISDDYSIEEARQEVLREKTNRERGGTKPLGMGRDYLDMEPAEAKEFSIIRAINAITTNDWRKAGLERAASEAVARQLGRSTEGFFVPRDTLVRAAYAVGTAGSGSTGGTLVGTNLLADAFIEVLRAKSRVMELGATVLSGLVGNVDVPRRTAATAAQWVVENGNLSESEGTFDKLSLSPKTIGTYSQISRNMLLQSTPDIEMLVRNDLAAVLALGIDSAAIAGTGTGAMPTGVLSTSGVGSVIGGVNGAQVTFDHLIDMATTLALANADVGKPAFLTNPKVLGWLSKTKSTQGEYLWPNRGQMSALNKAPVSAIAGANTRDNIGDFSSLGYPLAVSTQVPGNLTKGTSSGICSAVIFGNWSDVVIGEWGVLEILPNPYDATAYKQGAVLIRAMQSVDVGLRHGGSFVVMSDALTA